MSVSTQRLSVPAFDLAWYEYAHKENPHVFLLIPGGGGSTKSGVKNQIIIARCEYPGGKDIELLDSYFTDSDGLTGLCSGISTGTIQGKDILVALVDAHCFVLEATFDEAKKSLKFVKRLQFTADFHEEEPSLNTSLITSFGVVVTAGEDKIIRTWLVEEEKDEWTSSKIYELQDHTAPVSALVEHPSEPWICSAGKDGSCKIWNLKLGTLLIDIPYLVDGIPNFDPKKMKMECRGCGFSNDGKYFYSIQSPRRGSTFLVKWGLERKKGESIRKETKEESKEEEVNEKIILVAFPEKKKEVHKVPSTRLSISEDGLYVAIGASDGSVVLVQTENLLPVKKINCHDLPVTGLGFAPLHITKEKELTMFVATCSADNKLNLIQVKGYSTVTRVLLIAFIIFIVFLYVLTWGLHFEITKILHEK